ncbi:restriction endonuclease subunit S [Actinopolyspora erythraea]|uniref:Restriction endonuclease subunit S n=1 Tax=Actinopolyspora erythraea TaxID=414996 RepID=A0A223RSY6_9ACTN|nr:restriction endonuclease subunit S [Actinopolyspora erythraea]ASU78947.1 restriction endonuclease subunit S [Actinopolyspora erythraea]
MESVWPGKNLDLSQICLKGTVSNGYTRFEDGDVLVPKITPTFEASRSVLVDGLRNGAGAGTTELHVLRSTSRIEPRYLYYLTHSQPFLKLGEAAMYGVAGQKRVPDDFVRNFKVELPSLEEQRRIADFLDAETSRIDCLEEKYVKTDEVAFERFIANLASGVSRSSVWDESLDNSLPLRRVVSWVKTGATPPGKDESYFDTAGDVPWYGPASFGLSIDIEKADNYLSRRSVASSLVPIFPAEAVLLVGIGATAGKVGYIDEQGSGNQQITAITTNGNMRSRFLAWQLWAARDEMREVAPYTTLPIINNDFLKSLPVYVPSLAEQDAIVAQVDRDWRFYQDMSKRLKQAKEKLAERKQALITAAVTGQLDVTTAGRATSELRA